MPPHNRKQAVLESSLGGEREAYDGLALQGFIGVEAAIRELERERKKIAGVISMLKRIQLPRLYSGQADHRRLIRPALRQRLRPASPELQRGEPGVADQRRLTGRRRLSAEARRRMSLAAKKRWAARKRRR